MLGLYLVNRHAKLIAAGVKTAVVKKRHLNQYLSNDLILITKEKGVGYALGKIKLEKPTLMTASEINKRRNEHCVQADEMKLWWPGAKKLYFYKIKSFEKYRTPRVIDIKPGVQTLQVMGEDFIKEIDTYNPTKLRKKVLLDDWRIVSAWYSTKKRGGKMKYSREEILRLAKQIYKELLRRGVAPGKTTISKELISNFSKLNLSTMPIHRGYSEPDAEEIQLSDLTDKWDSAVIHKDFAYVVGSLANWDKTAGDIDILLKAEPGTSLWRIFTWRIMRAYPEFADRFHFCQFNEEWKGPFTNHVPLGDLVFMANKQLEIIEMKKDEIQDEFNIEKKDIVDIDNLRAMRVSSKNDEITPGQPFPQQKPQHGRQVGEAYNIDSLISVTNKTFKDWQDVGLFIGAKRDGVTSQWHLTDGTVKAWTEEGRRIEQNLPTIAKQFSNLSKGDLVVIGELELYEDSKHQPRADAAGIVNHLNKEREADIRLTIYDCFFKNGDDIHKRPYEYRREQYTNLRESANIKISSPEKKVKNEADLKSAVEKMSAIHGSEGAMLKLASAPYMLTIHPKPPSMIKFKSELQLVAKVLSKEPVVGAKAWVYNTALKDAPYAGKTYNTSVSAEVGDKLLISFVDISQYQDEKSGKTWFNMWAPHVLEKTNKPLTTAKEAMRMVAKTTGRIQKRKLPTAAGLPYQPETRRGFSDNNSSATEGSVGGVGGENNFLQKSRRYVVQAHFRGSTCHLDFRYQTNHVLDGFTLAAQTEELKDKISPHWSKKTAKGITEIMWDGEVFYRIENGKVIQKPSATLKRKVLSFHKGLISDSSLWKINLRNGEELKRKGGDEGEVQKVFAVQKHQEPYEWLSVEGVTDPLEVEEAGPGGTRFFPGIFVEIDKGTFELGADKPTFKELFLNGRWKGRVVFRIVPGLSGTGKLANWLYWKPDEQEPYVLSSRAVRESWLPKGYSALPADLERKIPNNLNYWKSGLSSVERNKRRKSARQFIYARKDMSVMPNFVLTRRFWKGQEVVRKRPVEDWHLKLNEIQLHLDKDLTKSPSSGIAFSGNQEYFTRGKYAPSSKINPNKSIPAFVEVIDSGPYSAKKVNSKRLLVKFDGVKLKGVYLIETTDGAIWTVKKRASQDSSTINFSAGVQGVSDFGKVMLAKDVRFPFPVKTVAFSEGTWHNRFYPWEVIRRAAPKIVGASFVTYHVGTNDPITHDVGVVTDYEIDDKNKRVIAIGELFDTTEGKDTAVLLANKRVKDVSVRITEDHDGSTCNEILGWPHVAFVRTGEVDDAKIIS